MSERPINLLLDDILEAIDRVGQYVKGLSFEGFFRRDRRTIVEHGEEILRLSARQRIAIARQSIKVKIHSEHRMA